MICRRHADYAIFRHISILPPLFDAAIAPFSPLMPLLITPLLIFRCHCLSPPPMPSLSLTPFSLRYREPLPPPFAAIDIFRCRHIFRAAIADVTLLSPTCCHR